jgi:hypothetical protein
MFCSKLYHNVISIIGTKYGKVITFRSLHNIFGFEVIKTISPEERLFIENKKHYTECHIERKLKIKIHSKKYSNAYLSRNPTEWTSTRTSDTCVNNALCSVKKQKISCFLAELCRFVNES